MQKETFKKTLALFAIIDLLSTTAMVKDAFATAGAQTRSLASQGTCNSWQSGYQNLGVAGTCGDGSPYYNYGYIHYNTSNGTNYTNYGPQGYSYCFSQWTQVVGSCNCCNCNRVLCEIGGTSPGQCHIHRPGCISCFHYAH